MAISYVGGVQGGRAGATSTTTQSLSGTLTGGSDTSPSPGDLVVVWCSSGGDGTGAPTNQAVSGNNSGAYTTETFQSITTATYDSFSQFNYEIQGGTVDTSLTIPSSGNVRNAQRWVVHVFRGVDGTTPIDTTSQAASGTATGRPNPAAITPATAGAWILGLYASAAATGAAYTAPTGFATDWLGGTTADTADCMQGAGYYTGWTSGPYDPAAITAGGTTNAADSWTARTVALRPQANNYPITCNSGSYTYTGSDATVSLNRSLSASAGSYTYTGSSADITKAAGAVDYSITANPGSYTYTGSSATLVKGRSLSTSAGVYAYTGSSATVSRNRALTANAGSYTYTGSSVTLVKGRVLTASAGSYAYTGSSATIKRDRSLIANSGAYTYTGSSITITYGAAATNYAITALSGAYTCAGNSITLARNRSLTASGGSYSLTGQSVNLYRNRALTASGGAYAYAGQSAILTKSGMVWPNPADVKAGVQYGPTGVDYTGTLVGGTVWLRRR